MFIYAAAMMVIGAKTWAPTLERFILGDRLDTRALVATTVSTFYGASAILGGVALTYQVGLGVVWFMLPFYLGTIVFIIWLQRIAGAHKYTLPDFLGGFYGPRFALASTFLLTTLCLVPEEIIASGKVLASFTGLPVEAAMGLMAVVLVVPVMAGGMRADVQTDIAQFGLMLVMLIVALPFVWLPGTTAPSHLSTEYLDPLALISPQEIAVFFVLLFFLPFTSAPLYQRLFVSESTASARKALLYSVGIWMAMDATVVLCGFAALQMWPALSDPDLALVAVGQALPGMAQPVFFVGLLATTMSTVNSFLQSGAASLAYDVVHHWKPSLPTRRLLWVSRGAVVVLGAASLGIALWFRQVVPALLFTLTMWTAGMLIPTLAALVGKRLPRKTALYCLLGGALSALVWEMWHPWPVDSLFVGLGVSLTITGMRRIIPPRNPSKQ